MESPKKKKLAVPACKRSVDDGDTPDTSMEDLCRKKFKPIAPKPVIRKDQHQSVLSAALPVKNDVAGGKEVTVLPSPKLDANSLYVMRPSGSLPLMCGGPMIMPIPVPVVPGKDGSYIPLQVPIPIPVMVPVVVSVNQPETSSASRSPLTVAADSQKTKGSSVVNITGAHASKKEGPNSLGASKQDKSPSTGTKTKPCRYKYSMIKNGSLFKDILRGVSGDFMANHGITFELPVSTGEATSTTQETSQDASSVDSIKDKSRESHARSDIPKETCATPLQTDQNGVQMIQSINVTPCTTLSTLEASRTQQAQIPSAEKRPPLVSVERQIPVIGNTQHTTREVSAPGKDGLTTPSVSSTAVVHRPPHHDFSTQKTYLNQPTSSCSSTILKSSSHHNNLQHPSSTSLQVPCTPTANLQVRQNSDGISREHPQPNRTDSSVTSLTTSTLQPFVQPMIPQSSSGVTVTKATLMSSVSGSNNPSQTSSASNVPVVTSSIVHRSLPSSTAALVESISHPQWNFSHVSQFRGIQGTPGSRLASHQSQNMPLSCSTPNRNSARLDDSSLYSMDEMHTFSVEMDQSSGSLLGSDDNVSAVLGMSDVGMPVSTTTTLSDSPTRRAVTAIVTPLPRSAAGTVTTTTGGSQTQVSETVRVTCTTHGSSTTNAESSTVSMLSIPNQATAPSTRNHIASSTQCQTNQVSGAEVRSQWSGGSVASSRQQQTGLVSVPSQTSVQSPCTVSTSNNCVPQVNAAFQGHSASTQGNLQITPFQTQNNMASCNAGQKLQSITSPHNHARNSHHGIHTAITYSSSSHAGHETQRQQRSASSHTLRSPSVNVGQGGITNIRFPNTCRTEHLNVPPSSGGKAVNSNQPVPRESVAGNVSRIPGGVPSQNEQSHYPENRAPNMEVRNHSQRAGENQQNLMQNGPAVSTQIINPGSDRQNISSTQNHPVSTAFSSSTFHTATQRPQLQMNAARMPSSSGIHPVWQPQWAGNAQVRPHHPPFANSVDQHHATRPSATAQMRQQPERPTPSDGNSTSDTLIASSSVQSVPLQSNLTARSDMGEQFQASMRTGHPAVPPTHPPHTRAGNTNIISTSHAAQVPVFPVASEKSVTAGNHPNPMNFSTPTNEPGPKVPYPLVPPIMFGNSAPVPGLPVGGIHGVPIPGNFSSHSAMGQSTQAPAMISAPTSPVHHPITPASHDRHRMYLPSHYSTLHRPLYMPPSPAPNSEIPLLSPHSYGQLHVHDSVLYSPRFPSSLHRLSPGVNNNFHPAPLHRNFPSTDHLDNYARNHLPHPSPHYENSIPTAPLRMPQVGQSSHHTADVASSSSSRVPRPLGSLQHSSILANREQNSLFEQNLQRLLAHSARRHSAAFAGAHRYSSALPCEHSLTHHPMGSLSSVSSSCIPHTSTTVSFSTPMTGPMTGLAQPSQPLPTPRLSEQPLSSRQSSAPPAISSAPDMPSATTVSTSMTATTSTVVTSRAIIGNTSDKYLPLELVAPDTSNAQTAPSSSAATTPSQVTGDQIVKCGDTVLQCSRQVLRESGRTVLCCWFCDYHTAEPRKMRRHQKKESEPLKCQLCSFHSDSRCAVNQHYKEEHMDKDDPFRSVPP
ncbi:uncharacterized protein [Diadema antillarum]|uniref:uncharacterized protein n=1 Tax=Diadema antillarum TaxID=105358 RepID=UPI003A8457D9